MSFWTSGTGKSVSGKPEDAFVKDFKIIPDGTIANAYIRNIQLVNRDNKHTGEHERYYEIIWKITSDDFKNREVSQKIKCFSGTPESIDRNLNMLRLLMTLCEYDFQGDNAPNEVELIPMLGKFLSIKIREWQIPKRDGSGIMEGNFVSEIYCLTDAEPLIGVKKSAVESALTRNTGMQSKPDDDLPF